MCDEDMKKMRNERAAGLNGFAPQLVSQLLR